MTRITSFFFSLLILSCATADGIDLSRSGLAEPEKQVVVRAAGTVAAQENIEPRQIRFVSIEPVEWRDASLGFPCPGMAYAQMLVPGHRVMLRHPGGRIIEAHTSATGVRTARDCE